MTVMTMRAYQFLDHSQSRVVVRLTSMWEWGHPLILYTAT
jgi:hypothetical protein